MNDSQANGTCILSDTVSANFDQLSIVAYNVMPLIHFFFGLSIHILCLIVLHRNSKEKAPYTYQVTLISVQTIEIIFYNIYCIDHYFGSFPEYARIYFFVWYSLHINMPILEGLIGVQLFLAVSMSADRVLRLALPIKYKTFQHKLHQRLALFISLCLGIFPNIGNMLYTYVEWDNENGMYITVWPAEYTYSTLAQVLAVVQLGLRLIGFITLIFLNAVLIYYYRKFKKSSGSMKSSSIKNEKMEKAEEKKILILTVGQLISVFFDTSITAVVYTIAYFVPVLSCYMDGLATISDIVLIMTSTLNLYLTLIFSSSIRNMFKKELPFLKCGYAKVTTVTPVSIISSPNIAPAD